MCITKSEMSINQIGSMLLQYLYTSMAVDSVENPTALEPLVVLLKTSKVTKVSLPVSTVATG